MVKTIRLKDYMISEQLWLDKLYHIKGYITIVDGISIKGLFYYHRWYDKSKPESLIEISGIAGSGLRQKGITMQLPSYKFNRYKHIMDKETILESIKFGEV